MDALELRAYCLKKKGVTESFPFNETTLVFKVGDKMFLLVAIDSQPLSFSAKANPEWSTELREEYSQITGAYHMNKTHWNSVLCEGLKPDFITKLIDHSYELVLNTLPNRIKIDIEK